MTLVGSGLDEEQGDYRQLKTNTVHNVEARASQDAADVAGMSSSQSDPLGRTEMDDLGPDRSASTIRVAQ